VTRRERIVSTIHDALSQGRLVLVSGTLDRGTRAAVQESFIQDCEIDVLGLNGDGHLHGYLAGFEPLLLDLLAVATERWPNLVAKHEQTLKRIWPERDCTAFRVSRDLTGTANREERTRFYHHEYQNKLLVGLAEFTLEVLATTGRRVILLIENADRFPPTSQSFLDTLNRLQALPHPICFVLFDPSGTLNLKSAQCVPIASLTQAEFDVQADLGSLKPSQREILFFRSRSDPDLGRALGACAAKGLNATDRLSAEAIIDLHLATLTLGQRLAMAEAFIAAGRSGDPIAQRNAETLPPGSLDEASATAHGAAMADYREGKGPLVLAHALSIHDRFRRIELLVEPCEILMGIGLYDTWFSIFAEAFSDHELQTYGSGDDSVNGLFINAAFVLYAMGYASAALPFLEIFLEKFPKSRFVPTALYAQSMTYGRYQIPVDLPRAEAYATLNLALIDAQFADHPRYIYIKVFAENAYAYIKARQGKFSEALAMCERGITDIVKTYGEDNFRLHRSILMYNTSQVYELVGDLGRAEDKLRETIACDPHYAEYHNDLGNLLARILGREDEALAEYETAIRFSPPYYEAHLNRGMLLTQMGDAAGAAADFQRALTIKPSEWRALRELGNLSLAEGDSEQALRFYESALEIEIGDADLHANTGLAASNLGDVAKALRHGEIAVALDPRHAGAHNNLAAELTGLGRLDDALRHGKCAVEHSNDPDFSANLAVLKQIHLEWSRQPAEPNSAPLE